jgi:pimeloyl-ACP methyl ester carboxylesterase
MVAGGNDPISSAADLAEFRATISPFGFRRSVRVQPDELRRLTVPTLLIWGDHDPVGTREPRATHPFPPVGPLAPDELPVPAKERRRFDEER